MIENQSQISHETEATEDQLPCNSEEVSTTNNLVYAVNLDTNASGKFIPDTKDERQKAIAEGYNAFSIYTFSSEPPKRDEQKDEPIRFGDLVLHFQISENPAKSIGFIQEFVQKLRYRVKGFIPEMLTYQLDGTEFCSIMIPSAMYGGENGHPYLPIVQKEMVRQLLYNTFYNYIPVKQPMWNNLNISYLTIKSIPVLRTTNTQRPDGKYVIRLSALEFLTCTPEELIDMTNAPYTKELMIIEPEICDLQYLYQRANIHYLLCVSPKKAVQLLGQCAFIRYCISNCFNLTQDQWKLLLRILSRAGASIEIVQEFCKENEKYQGNVKQELIDAGACELPSCATVKECFTCPENCQCDSILNRIFNPYLLEMYNKFHNSKDGLFMVVTNDGKSHKERISSPLEVLGQVKTPEHSGWGQLVEFTDDSGIKKKVILPRTDLIGKGDAVIGKLVDLGFVAECRNKYLKDILDYIYSYPSSNFYVRVNKIWWYDKKQYILPDKTWGNKENITVYYEGPENLFTVSGTLEDWKNHVGIYCQGNRLPVFVCAYALIGVLLELLDIESCGVHLPGPSSSGKTTLAKVSGSVCGGHPQRGFLRQWNATANSVEKIAAMHNDNLLVLDEIGQATSDAVATIAYMLSNEQGKTRMKQDASLRAISTWSIAFLSTGEMSFGDKIEQTGKNKSMAGQEVRVINIPVDARKGENIFTELHGLSSSQDVSAHLQKMTKKFWGTPLRAFLDALFGETESGLPESITIIGNDIARFLKENVPDNSNGQVIRVAKRFALIAAAGNFACNSQIFPWTAEENWKSVKSCFEIWLEERGGVESLEIAKAIENLDKYIDLNHFTKFVPLSYTEDIKRIPNFTGYRAEDETIVYIQPPILKNIIGKSYFDEVLKTLNSEGRLELDSNGSWIIFKQIYNHETESKRSMRLIGIRVKNPPIKIDEKDDSNNKTINKSNYSRSYFDGKNIIDID